MKHWKTTDTNEWVVLTSPTFIANIGKQTPFGVIREMYREWKVIEKAISQSSKHGWISDTEADNWPMIRFLTTAGATPYRVDVKNKAIWFFKTL